MTERPGIGRRRGGPTLHDGLVLIGGTAAGLGALRWAARSMNGMEPSALLADMFAAPAQGWHRYEVAKRLTQGTVLALSLVGGWTIVLPLYRRGRTWRRMARQPGTIACLAAWMGMLLGAASWAISVGVGWNLSGPGAGPIGRIISSYLSSYLISEAGFAVALAWGLLLATGRWRPARDWLDRVGVGVGVVWIAAGLAWSVRNHLFG